MAKVDITVPGERIVESFTALVPQPTAPSTARAPDVGLVELSYVNPTVLVPGPPGPPGPAGSRWYTGVGDPGALPGLYGDMYLDDVTGQIWTYNGVAWVNTGTDLSPDAIELLNKIKTVDGAGSGLDADTLDGHDSTYFATDADMTAAEAAIDALEADLALKAPLASPTFTGDPKAPTPPTADNDTSIATTAYVKANLATIVGGAIISDTAPGSPQAGQLWFESDSGSTFIWFNDGTSSQWVQQNAGPGGSAGSTGAVQMFAVSVPPPGWMKANGAAVSRATYAALFAVIGTAWGVGDGSTTFNVPDLRGEFLRGWDDSRGVDSGRAFGSAQTAAVESHTHAMSGSTGNDTPDHTHYMTGAFTSGGHSADHTHTPPTGQFAVVNGGTPWATVPGPGGNLLTHTSTNWSSVDHSHTTTVTFTSGGGSVRHTHPITGTNANYGGAETRPRNIALLMCIKY